MKWYLYKFYADQKIKNVQLTKENFTFSSKYIVGNYLLPLDDQKFLDASINHNNIKSILDFMAFDL
ncbi:hypothetical protein BpHYR1_049835 [Brachionus plicatilis]|uniref:Uncharacterized protein n=1 Tax=Brachionus plicatilis TaxID=10195 RepID=A0A3M7RRW8_BRAPC|nr:hypothetical protein BpHYR1_049835 [Brachionus plicatilis]